MCRYIQIFYYGDLPREAEPRQLSDPDPTWPTAGEVTFENVGLQYRPDLPLVLKGLSFNVKAGEKVGQSRGQYRSPLTPLISR
jgi:ATP-binding cassette subfamily C (CFTR/MRP) protein 1